MYVSFRVPKHPQHLSVASHADCQHSSGSVSLNIHIIVPLVCPRSLIRVLKHSGLTSRLKGAHIGGVSSPVHLASTAPLGPDPPPSYLTTAPLWSPAETTEMCLGGL